MDNYTIGELSIGIVSIIGSIGGCCLILFKSKCLSVSLCWGLIDLERDAKAIEMEVKKDIEKGEVEGI